MDLPEGVLEKELFTELRPSNLSVVGADWFRLSEKLLAINQDDQVAQLFVTVQIVTFEGPHNPPYMEERVIFNIDSQTLTPIVL
ncbi:DUF3888 domain-containing protein [Cytobacillus purgationiresistens]|uniref:Uncharacterized protein n=1 Tax=Cytobacillus purgationiresistens TaxID=863449 RepID=A0ABU0AB25_9BACI|nr:DUF3888 domain-containing protein [Cytobacillus purgationiresistens]MDQ0268449.1 hypothetical protein [Cytobacillus purgationiresistens]